MLTEIFFSLLSSILEYFFRLLSYISKRISPLSLSPKKIDNFPDENWDSILTLEMKNTLNTNLYDINIVGVSKTKFDIEIINDNQPNEKSVKYMNINTNSLVIHVQDIKTKNYGWIYRLHKIEGKGKLIIKFKIRNTSPVHFKVLHYSFDEALIRERNDGVVAIPFVGRKLPKI